MKRVHLTYTLLTAAVLCGCGTGSPKLQRVTISPAIARAATVPQQQVQFMAQGTFDNNTIRALALADGILWASSNPKVAAVNASGVATCLAPGSSTIVVTAPTASHMIVSTAGSGTTSAVLFPGGAAAPGSPTVSGSAALTCVL